MSKEVWSPDRVRKSNTFMRQFSATIEKDWQTSFKNYSQLHRWSIENPEPFWTAVWTTCGVVGDKGPPPHIFDADRMPGAHFFPSATLNYAENLLAHPSSGDAIVFRGENNNSTRLSWPELHTIVARMSAHLRTIGLSTGDRVAAVLPNCPEAIVAMLSVSAIGATWSSCSPDFGPQGILDRFSQISPRILIAADGYTYGGKSIDLTQKIAETLASLPSVEHVLIINFVGHAQDTIARLRTSNTVASRSIIGWQEAVANRHETEPQFTQLPFSHPLYILFSSGTTGTPKCIVHSAGGILLKHLSEHQFHCDLKPGDRLFYFTTLGWMMWNWLVSGLATGATLMLYDGNPFYPNPTALWDYVEADRITHFGTSAKYIDAMKKAALKPGATHDLESIRCILSTGSPLVPESFDYVYESIKQDIHLASVSGGTDICGCFVLGNPAAPVNRGEIQCAALGMDVAVYDSEGHAVIAQKGELVCRNPFPSMPLGFWNDPAQTRYLATYFQRFPNNWHHGDFAEQTPGGGFIIYGRSDATLNPGGVRIGTAEIYRQVEQLKEITECVAISQDWLGDVRIILFVVLSNDLQLDSTLIARIKDQIRNGASPRHVPAKIIQVTDIPRTKSGKITELAIRDVVHSHPVANLEALANPEALSQFINLEELKS